MLQPLFLHSALCVVVIACACALTAAFCGSSIIGARLHALRLTVRRVQPHGWSLLSMMLLLTLALPALATSYTVTTTAGSGGTISPGTSSISSGGKLTFTAKPGTGYGVAAWVYDGNVLYTGGIAANGFNIGLTCTLSNITANHTLAVYFRRSATYMVFPSAGANGTITPYAPQTMISGGSILFTAAANAGFTTDSWWVDGIAKQTGGAKYTLSPIGASHAVKVTFKALPKYLVTPTAGLHGAITPATQQTVIYGNSVTFIALPNTGYTTNSWSVDGIFKQSGGAKYTLSNVTASHTVVVNFKQLTYTVTPTAGPNGTISPSTAQAVSYGSNKTFTALPSAGYQVKSWTLDGVVKQNGGTTYVVSNVTAPHQVNVSFMQINTPPTISQVPYLTVNVNSGPQSVPLSGITPGNAGETGQTMTITATSNKSSLIPNPRINYASPATTGTLMFTPAINASGAALITVKVQDNGGTANGGSDTTTMSFLVTVRSPSGLMAWGNNSAGQCTFSTAYTSVLAIAGGWYHTVALKQDGTVQCWGGTNDGEANVPAGLSGVTAIAAGGTHTVALLNSGKVIAWGNNHSGECTVPTAALSGVAAIAAGDSHTVALKYDGTVLCWGSNASGQCTVLPGLSGVVAIAAGAQHTVALKGNGTVVAWGDNSYGQRAVPSHLAGIQAIAAGAYHTLALTSGGQVIGWGANDQGQSTAPAGLSAVQIAAGKYHSVALKADGTVACWGGGKTNTGMTPEFGQSIVPNGLTNVQAVAAGSVHTIISCPVGTPTTLTFTGTPALSNQPIGTTIGTFATQPSYLAPFTYTLVRGYGPGIGSDNAAFTIAGNVLKTKVVLDYAKQSSYSIYVRTTDQFGDFLEKTFTITVPPTITGVNLSPSTVTEFSPAGTLVGTFTASPDSNFPFSYLLVNGAGSADNALFTIDGNKLKLATTAPDALKQPTCSIRVRVVDRYAQYAEAPMTITVLPQSRPDLTIFNGTSWLGAGIYNADGTGQTCLMTCNASGTGYSFAVLNRGASADSFQFTIAGVDPAWTVACYDLAASTTTPLAGTSWTTPSLAPNTARTYFVSVLPGATVTSGAQLSLLITAKSVRNAQRLDAVKAITTRQTVQPPITGITLNPYTVTEYAPVGTVIGTLATLPSGNAPFTYTLVSGTGSDDNGLFTIAGSQLTLAKIAPDALLQATCKIRVRVSDKYSQTAELPLTLPIVARYRPDLEIYDGKAWVGQRIFNADATNQTVKLTCNASGTAYSIAVLNMGASADTFQLTVTGLDSAWKVYCYDAGFTPPKVLDGTSWTTPAIAGYAVRTYVVYPVPTSTVVSGQVLTLLITAKSVGNAARLDAVKATTTRQ